MCEQALSRHCWDRTWAQNTQQHLSTALSSSSGSLHRVQLLSLLLVASLLDVSFLLSAHKRHNAFSHLLHSLITSSPHTILPVLFSMAFQLPRCNCTPSSFRFRKNFLLSGPHYQTPAQSQPLPAREEVPVSPMLAVRRFALSSCEELQYTSRLDRLSNTSSSERQWTGPVHTSSIAFGRKPKLLKAERAELGTQKCVTFAARLSHFLSSQWEANKAAPAAATGTRCSPAPTAQLLAVERTRLGWSLPLGPSLLAFAAAFHAQPCPSAAASQLAHFLPPAGQKQTGTLEGWLPSQLFSGALVAHKHKAKEAAPFA